MFKMHGSQLAALLLAACCCCCCDQQTPRALRRIIALPDIHGDLEALEDCLLLSRLIASRGGAWAASANTTLVQLGDMVDGRGRGLLTEDRPGSLAVLQRLRQLQEQAAAAGNGGRVVVLLGNHELMNMRGNARYAAQAEVAAAGGQSGWLAHFGRKHAVGAWLRSCDMVYEQDGVVFSHAGVLPQFASWVAASVDASVSDRVAQLNGMLRSQLLECVGSETSDAQDAACNTDSLMQHGPLWNRELMGDCERVHSSLQLLGARMMVLGHTPLRSGGSQFCGSSLVNVDVGMSR